MGQLFRFGLLVSTHFPAQKNASAIGKRFVNLKAHKNHFPPNIHTSATLVG